MAEAPQSGDYGGGYLKVQRHLRTSVLSVGFALVTAAASFSADLTVPSIAQSQLTGYKYPVKQVRHTQPQDGWLYTAANSGGPAFDPTVTVAPIGQSQLARSQYLVRTRVQTNTTPQPVYNVQFQNNSGERTAVRAALRYQYANYPNTDWIYQNLPVADVWDASKFQNISGEMTTVRDAIKFRYPIASTGFSTDGSTPDVFDGTKFQSVHWERTAERRQYDPRYEYHKFSFGLLDARVISPALNQLASSERTAKRKSRQIVTQESIGWIYTNLPAPFDPQYLVHTEDSRLRDRYKKVPQLDQPSQAWIFTALPQFDPQYITHRNDGRLRERHKKFPQLDQPAQGWVYTSSTQFDPQYIIHSSDDRLRERYKKVPLLDQPVQGWGYTAITPFDPQYLIQISAPHRMADREQLDVRLAQFYNDMAWLRDVLTLPDPPVTPNLGRLFIDLDTGHLLYRITP